MNENVTEKEMLTLTAEIVAAHVGNNATQAGDLPSLISEVHRALASLNTAPISQERPQPAVPVRRSVTSDYLICLEDGKKLKMLKRHLKTAYNMTPDEYRTLGVPVDYPMFAPSYAHHRSSLAKRIGLGT